MLNKSLNTLESIFNNIGVPLDNFAAIGKYKIFSTFLLLLGSIILFLSGWLLYKFFHIRDDVIDVMSIVITLEIVGFILLVIFLTELPSVMLYLSDPKAWIVKYIFDNYKFIILK